MGGTTSGRAFRWTEQTCFAFRTVGDNGEPIVMSADGSTLAFTTTTHPPHALLWRGNSARQLPDPPTVTGLPYTEALSADASAAIGIQWDGNNLKVREGGIDHPVWIWDAAHGTRDLQTLLRQHGVDVPEIEDYSTWLVTSGSIGTK